MAKPNPDALFSAIGAIKAALTPTFTAEGPQFYQQAYQQNHTYAKPGPYRTDLTPMQEALFRHWVQAHNVPFDPNAGTADYDMRGYWLASGGKPYTGGHFPDTYKTPYDTTFSAESRYATPNNPYRWQGDKLVNTTTGQVVFAPPKAG